MKEARRDGWKDLDGIYPSGSNIEPEGMSTRAVDQYVYSNWEGYYYYHINRLTT